MPKNPSSGPFDVPLSTDNDDQAGANERRAAARPGVDGHPGPEARPAEPAPGGNGAMQGEPARSSTPSGRTVGERKKQFLVAPRPGPGGLHALALSPLSISGVENALRNNPDIEVLDTVGPRNAIGMLADGMGGGQGVLVARMTEQKAATLYQQGGGRLLVERDQHLALLDPQPQMRPSFVSSVLPSAGPGITARIKVVGKDGAPVADAEVSLFGSMLPASAATDANGEASVTLFGESTHTISGLYVKPKSDYWSLYHRDPDISIDEPNVVILRALSEWAPLIGFPGQRAVGWGQKAMRMEALPAHYRGQGIKIAVIDSGIGTSHDCLKGVRAGFDIVNKRTNPNTWNEDTLGHGSHCAGVIGAAELAIGLRGFAPDAEIHACKLFPGGQVSQLIDALEYCIDNAIDVVNLSLGGAEPSEALEQQILRAKQAGIACIVAAGNSGGPVQYPASSPNVLAVAAVGKIDEFPPDSYHAQTIGQDVDANGYFTASFSCFGPQIDVCGPGVAIASTVPPNNYAAWDGTSMAAPHITGLAALVLAHHPEFQSVFKARTAERVERLFQQIRLSARRVSIGDTTRVGYGLPDAMVAVGLQAPKFAHAMATQALAGQAMSAQASATPPLTNQAMAQQAPTAAAPLTQQFGNPIGAPPASAGMMAPASFGTAVGPGTGAGTAAGPGSAVGLGATLDPFAVDPTLLAMAALRQQGMLGQPFGILPGLPFGLSSGLYNPLW